MKPTATMAKRKETTVKSDALTIILIVVSLILLFRGCAPSVGYDAGNAVMFVPDEQWA